MIYKASERIAATFDEYDVKYRIEEVGEMSSVEAAFEIPGGPDVVVRFISDSDRNDVAVRVLGLVRRVPQERRERMLEACNELNNKVRDLKFTLDFLSNVDVEADLLVETDDSCVGPCCFELFIRFMHVLNDEFHVLMEALYGESEQKPSRSADLLQMLEEMRRHPIAVTDENDT